MKIPVAVFMKTCKVAGILNTVRYVPGIIKIKNQIESIKT